MEALEKYSFDKNAYLNELVPFYRNNPVKFCEEMLGITPCGWQAEFLNYLAKEKPDGTRVALASGHETGKTYIICAAMIWGVFVFPDCHIYCTSATKDQLETRMWSYMQRIVSESRIASWFKVDTEKAVFRYLAGNIIYARAWSKDKPDSWAGEHCHSAWGVFDECADIDKVIFDAWEGTSYKANAFTILMSQPTRRHGALYEAFYPTKEDSKYNFWTRHITCMDSPFSTPAFRESMKEKYGEDSDFYRIRVLGQFPHADVMQMMFPNNNKIAEKIVPSGYPVAGLDIAAGGNDKTVLIIRRGNIVVAIYKFNTENHVALAPVILATLQRHACEVVCADTIGVGHGLVNILQQNESITVVSVDGRKLARNPKKYHNRRSEAYGRLADAWANVRFMESVSQTDIDKVIRQLEAVKCQYDNDMRIQVILKQDMKAELGESPDYADALAYSYMGNEDNAPDKSQYDLNGNISISEGHYKLDCFAKSNIDMFAKSRSGQRVW